MADPTEPTIDTRPAILRGRSSTNQPRATTAEFFRRNLQPPFDFPDDDLNPTRWSPTSTSIGTVDQTRDGDTVRMADGTWVRLTGIDTPEIAKGDRPAQPFAEEAKARLQELLQDPDVTLEHTIGDKDKYNRTLAHLLTASGQNVQEILLQEGLAEALSIEPNTRLTELYRILEKQAKDDKIGMWANPVPKKEVGAFEETVIPDGYIPSHLRTLGEHTGAEPAATPIIEDLINNIQDDGFLANVYNWQSDLLQPKASDQDLLDIENAMPNILAEFGLSPAVENLITDKAKTRYRTPLSK